MAKPTSDEIRFAITSARTDHEREGEIEIDEPEDEKDLAACVSACNEWREEGGFYVKAWVWVEVPQ